MKERHEEKQKQREERNLAMRNRMKERRRTGGNTQDTGRGIIVPGEYRERGGYSSSGTGRDAGTALLETAQLLTLPFGGFFLR